MTIPTGYGQASIFFVGNGAPHGAAITFGFKNNADQTAQECAADVVHCWTTSGIMGNLSGSVATTKVRVKLGPDETGNFHEQAMSIGGGLATTNTPPNVAFLLKKQTNLGGRKGRGRCYLPGVLEADVNADGGIIAARQTNLGVDAAEVLAEMIVRDIPMVLLHGDATTPSTVAAWTLDPLVATQRRRLRS
jgi:hypothetical protein